MTKSEKQKIRKAINLLMEGEGAGWNEAMETLCRLVGVYRPEWDIARNAKAVDFRDLIARFADQEDQPFYLKR